MARVASFEFYEDPVAHTNASVCTINWTAMTVTYPGVTSVAFAQCDELVAVLGQLIGQNEADNIVETVKVITGGAADLAVTFNKNVTPRTVAPGASPFPVTKAADLAAGLQTYVLDEITPPGP